MTEPSPSPDAARDRGVEAGRGSTVGTPRWVKVLGILALVAVVLVAVSLLAGGDHGPGRHAPTGDPGGATSVPGVTGDHTPPKDGHG